MLKKIMLTTTLVLSLLLIVVGYKFYPQLGVATGYAAKKVCTCTFVEDRSKEEVQQNDLYFSILPMVKNTLDKSLESVTSTFFGLSPQTAIYKPGLGCVLLQGEDDYNVKFPSVLKTAEQPEVLNEQPLVTEGIDLSILKNAIDVEFNTDGNLSTKQTTSILVIHRDTLIAERYAPPFTRDMSQLGWSMTKSWMNAFAGILVKDGLISIEQDHLFPEWKNDYRKDIKLKHLLNMDSGLEWNEDYATVSDATRMLYYSEDVSSIALSKTLAHNPGIEWYYSSGTTNLLSRYYRNILGNESTYLTFLKQRLFDVLNMSSAFIETDESGTMIGSSYGYATPRDWAKFGLLYLHDGIWQGQRILPEGWVDFTKTVVDGSNGKYGAQFWLNQNGIQYPDAPHDMIIADGFLGQYVFVIPSYDVVIVRMGTGKASFDTNIFLKNVLSALPKAKY